MGAAADFILKNFLILGLLCVIAFGLLFPGPGTAAKGLKIGTLGLGDIAVIIIFIVSGTCLESVSDCMQPKALGLGIFLVLFVTPLAAIPMAYLGEPKVGVIDSTLSDGMALFCLVPTTLSSGVTMITQARGNVSLAIALTSITNILGVFIMPWTVSKIFNANVEIKPMSMLSELLWLTLAPLLFGMALRKVVKPVARFAKTNKKPLGISQNCCILTVVWMMTSFAQPLIFSQSAHDLSVTLLLAASLHLVYRIVGYAAATAAALEGPEWVSIVLMCSQKSLPVCVSVMTSLPPSLQASTGLMTVPCIMAHASQLIIDSILAVRWQLPEAEESRKQSLLAP